MVYKSSSIEELGSSEKLGDNASMIDCVPADILGEKGLKYFRIDLGAI